MTGGATQLAGPPGGSTNDEPRRAPAAILLSNEDGSIAAANEGWAALLGVESSTLRGRRISDLAPVDDAAEKVRFLQAALGRGECASDVFLRHKDGSLVSMELSVARFDIEGKPMRLVLGRDTTRQRRLEEGVQRAQRMEAIGQLTGGIAHDFNNILAAILANAHFLIQALPEGDARRSDAEEIKAAAERAAVLTRQLLAFSRKPAIEPKRLCLNETVVGLQKMLQRLIGEDIELATVLQPDLAQVRVDSGQMEQVLMNLVVNARDAMPKGGTVRIETTNVELTEQSSASDGAVPAGRYVMLSVSDTGSGMNEETKQRLFEPFFTTKDVGRGTGLGLSTCHEIVEQSQGYIAVESQPGAGSVFRVYLPTTDGAVQPEPQRLDDVELEGDETVC